VQTKEERWRRDINLPKRGLWCRHEDATMFRQLQSKYKSVAGGKNKTTLPVTLPVTNEKLLNDAAGEVFVDPHESDSRSKKIQLTYRPPKLNPPYGLDYSPPEPEAEDEYAAVEACIARNRAETPAQETVRFRKELLELDTDSSSEEELVFTPPAAPVEFLTQRGVCETLYLNNDSSQSLLIAMTQGLVARPADPYPSTYVFDMENDDLLKNFPQKALFFPTIKILKEEVSRRALVKSIKPLKKSSTKPAIIEWLKKHAVTDPLDEAFLMFEVGKTYRAIMMQSQEAAAVASESLTNKNWTTMNWLRLYHAALCDEAKVKLREADSVMTRQELDARNSASRPSTYYEKVAELYNSDVIYVTESLPELHSTFAESAVLAFEDMPGGEITADEAKARLGDARAKMITVSLGFICSSFRDRQ
jgi:hypothetical protein